MDSLKETRRQIIIAIDILIGVLAFGVIGFMAIEKISFLDALWITVTTLTTIGYGDIVAQTQPGRVFTIILIMVGLSAFAYGLQASATFFVSPIIREIRQRRRTQRLIERLENHYIICGAGELVDNTTRYLLEGAHRRQMLQQEQIYRPVDRFLDRIFGDDAHGHFPRMRGFVRRIYLFVVRQFHRAETLLDVVVVITPDVAFAEQLRASNLLVIDGEPINDEVLIRAGIQHAHAMMVLLDNDTEALLAVLTARSLNPTIDIIAGTMDEQLAAKMIRVGANEVLAPYEVAGQFLNNATLRPAVNEFFNSILFSQAHLQTAQITLQEQSRWIGRQLGSLSLRERFQAGVIGLRQEGGNYIYAPGDDYNLRENDTLIVVAPGRRIPALQQDCYAGPPPRSQYKGWQRLYLPASPRRSTNWRQYTLEESAEAVSELSAHYIVCGSDRVARNAIAKLDPQRPFAVVSDDESYSHELLEQGFRVIHGNPTLESTLRKAGIDRALAIMVAVEDPAGSVLTVLNARTLSKRILITVTAQTREIIPKLRRAGADRVVSPFEVAAQFVLLATTRPAVSDFLQYVVYNYQAGIETTELYMQDDSPWIGKTVDELNLDQIYRAGIIGIRQAGGGYLYAPPPSHLISEHEVLIIVTPMEYSDELRLAAHGGATKRPVSIRRDYFDTRA